jgi:protein disulfide-isomerase A1
LKLFRKGSGSIDYNGGRTAADIVSYMKKQAAPVISELTADKVESFSQSDKVVVVGFFNSKSDAEYTSFAATAQTLRDSFLFGAVFSKEANEKYEVTPPSVILFKQFDEGKNVFTGEQLNDLAANVKAYAVPLIDEIGPENYRTYVESVTPLAYLFVDLQVPQQKETNVEKIHQIAKDTKGKINWVYIDWSKYSKHSERLGLSGNTVPAIAIEDPVSGKHWAFDETAAITTEAVKTWVDSFLEGKLEPTIRSEPVPEKQDGPVTILVANNFEQIVKDENKDVFVEFYAPWCGHCKKLAPVFDELGKALKGVDSVVIGKIDATANDVDPKLEIRGFPTLKFFPANSKASPIDYNGDRSLKDMLEFVHKQASKSFTLPEVKETDDHAGHDHDHDEL